jgi:hypothetical protein
VSYHFRPIPLTVFPTVLQTVTVSAVDDPGAAREPFDYGAFSFASKDEVLAKSKQFWNPDKTQFWID